MKTLDQITDFDFDIDFDNNSPIPSQGVQPIQPISGPVQESSVPAPVTRVPKSLDEITDFDFDMAPIEFSESEVPEITPFSREELKQGGIPDRNLLPGEGLLFRAPEQIQAGYHRLTGQAMQQVGQAYDRDPGKDEGYEDRRSLGKNIADKAGIDPAKIRYQGTNPLLPQDKIKNLPQYEREALFTYLYDLKRGEQQRLGQAFKDTGKEELAKAEKLDPTWYKAEKYQQKIAEIEEMDPGIAKSWKMGDVSGMADVLVADAILSGDKNAVAQALDTQKQAKELGQKDAEYRQGREGFAAKLDNVVNSTANILPMMSKGIAANIAGMALPGVGQLAAKAYTTSLWARQGMGDVAGEIADQGLDPSEHIPLLTATGLIYALIENIQVGQVQNIGGLKAPVKESLKKSLFNLLREKGQDYISENLEEVVQEMVTTGAFYQALKDSGIKVDSKEIAQKLSEIPWETIKETSKPLGLLTLMGLGAGAGRLTYGSLKSTIKDKKKSDTGITQGVKQKEGTTPEAATITEQKPVSQSPDGTETVSTPSVAPAPKSDKDTANEFLKQFNTDADTFWTLPEEERNFVINQLPEDQQDILYNLDDETAKAQKIEEIRRRIQEIERPDEEKSEIESININPTKAQQKAGTYRKAHIKRDGFDISIENAAGSERSGTDKSGKEWRQEINHDYGYIRGTKGADAYRENSGDQVDIFIKPNSPEGGTLFVVDQIDPETGEFDEHKVMAGFNTAEEAKVAYLSNYEKDWKGFKDVTPMSQEEFKEWVYSVNTMNPAAEWKKKIYKEKSPKSKPVLEYVVSKTEKEIPKASKALKFILNKMGVSDVESFHKLSEEEQAERFKIVDDISRSATSFASIAADGIVELNRILDVYEQGQGQTVEQDKSFQEDQETHIGKAVIFRGMPKKFKGKTVERYYDGVIKEVSPNGTRVTVEITTPDGQRQIRVVPSDRITDIEGYDTPPKTLIPGKAEVEKAEPQISKPVESEGSQPAKKATPEKSKEPEQKQVKKEEVQTRAPEPKAQPPKAEVETITDERVIKAQKLLENEFRSKIKDYNLKRGKESGPEVLDKEIKRSSTSQAKALVNAIDSKDPEELDSWYNRFFDYSPVYGQVFKDVTGITLPKDTQERKNVLKRFIAGETLDRTMRDEPDQDGVPVIQRGSRQEGTQVAVENKNKDIDNKTGNSYTEDKGAQKNEQDTSKHTRGAEGNLGSRKRRSGNLQRGSQPRRKASVRRHAPDSEYGIDYWRAEYFHHLNVELYNALAFGWRDRNQVDHPGRQPGWIDDYNILTDGHEWGGKQKKTLSENAKAYLQHILDHISESGDLQAALERLGVDQPEHIDDIRSWLEQSLNKSGFIKYHKEYEAGIDAKEGERASDEEYEDALAAFNKNPKELSPEQIAILEDEWQMSIDDAIAVRDAENFSSDEYDFEVKEGDKPSFYGYTNEEIKIKFGSIKNVEEADNEIQMQLDLFRDKGEPGQQSLDIFQQRWNPEVPDISRREPNQKRDDSRATSKTYLPVDGLKPFEGGVSGDWKKHKRVNLTGYTIKEHGDVARLFSIYRHPRIEHFHIVYLNDNGEILAHNAISSGIYNACSVFEYPKNIHRSIYNIERRMERLGATGYYIVHNHPSGDISASDSDKRVTSIFDLLIPGFKGHVILDHTEYTLIDKRKMTYWDTYKPQKEYKMPDNSKRLSTPDQVAAHANKIFKQQVQAAIIYLNTQNTVVAWEPIEIATLPSLNIQSIYQKGRKYGSMNVIIATNKESLIPVIKNRLDLDSNFNIIRAVICADESRWTFDEESVIKSGKHDAYLRNKARKGGWVFEDRQVDLFSGGPFEDKRSETQKEIDRTIREREERLRARGKGLVGLPLFDKDEQDTMATKQEDLFNQEQKEEKKSSPVPPKEEKSPAEKKSGKIEDFGEKIGGARKDYWASYSNEFASAKEKDIASVPLSESWPQPDYDKLIEEGSDPYIVAFVHAMRDEIPTKPQSSWKVRRWVSGVQLLRGLAENLLTGKISKETFQEKLSEPAYRNIAGYVGGRGELYEVFGHSKSLKGVIMGSHYYTKYNGEENVTKWIIEKRSKTPVFANMPSVLGVGNTKEEAIEGFRKKYESLSDQKGQKEVNFDIYTRTRTGQVFIGKKIGSEYIDLKQFDTVKEAAEYLKNNKEELVKLLNQFKAIPSERRAFNRKRIGKDHRNGKDVTPEMFSEAFGFRGVEFGNWVNDKERRDNLNQAYDALMDLASILNIPSRAISLNGELGLAFGSRGHGGKIAPSAHYEPEKIVINLTRKNGPGSLAHEWWHAFDNYITRSNKMASLHITEASQYEINQSGIRKELVDAFKGILKAIYDTNLIKRSAELDRRRTKVYWRQRKEMSARAFENYIIDKLKDMGANNDYLANVATDKEYTDAIVKMLMGGELPEKIDIYPYLLDDELPGVKKEFDNLFRIIKTREENNNVAIFAEKEGVGSEEYSSPSEVTKNMMALHNLSEKDLLLVDKMGGMAAPSIAVLKKELPHSGFGKITLIAPKQLIDPQKVPVYSSDVYSGTVPEPTYRVNKKDGNKFLRDLINISFKIGDNSYYSEIERHINNGDRNRAVSEMLDDVMAGSLFLSQQGEKLERFERDVDVEYSEIITNPDLKTALEEEWFADDAKAKDYVRVLKKAVKEHVSQQIPDDASYAKELEEAILGDLIDSEGNPYFGPADRMRNNLRKIGKKEFDRRGYKEYIENKIEKIGRDKFKEWVEGIADKIFHSPYIDKRGKPEYNLENIVAAIIKAGNVGVQEAITFSLNQAKSFGSKRFKSMEDLKAAYSKITDYKTYESEKEKVEKKFFKLVEDLAKNYIYADPDKISFSRLDDMSRALAAYYKGSKTQSSARSALSKNGYQNVSDSGIRKFIYVAQELIDTPVVYFEAKMQRAVGLGEFAGAVIPNNSTKTVRDILEKNNIPYVEYDPEIEGDRESKISNFQATADIYFARKRQDAGTDAQELKVDRSTPEEYSSPTEEKLVSALFKQAGKSPVPGVLTIIQDNELNPVSTKLKSVVEEITGKEVNFLYIDTPELRKMTGYAFDGVTFHGNVSPELRDKIFIDIQSQRPVLWTAFHEFAHFLEQNTDYKNQFWNAVKLTDEGKAKLAQKGESEFAADIIGEMMSDARFWENLARHNEGTFKAIVRKFIEILSRVSREIKKLIAGSGFDRNADKVYERYIRETESLRSELAKILMDYNRGVSGSNVIESAEKIAAAIKRESQIYTPEFKKWFGDWENDPENSSKVVGEDGKPIVVYHGGDKEIADFSKGSNRGYMGTAYFTDNEEAAQKYALLGGIDSDFEGVEDYKDALEKSGIERSPTITKAYLNIRNPLHPDDVSVEDVIKALGKDSIIDIVENDSYFYENEEELLGEDYESVRDYLSDGDNLKEYLDEEYSSPDIVLENDHDSLGGPGETTAGFNFLHLAGVIEDYMNATGHDGWIFEDKEAGGTTYVPLSPNQIKSATDNTGSFSPENPDIRFAEKESLFSDFDEGKDKAFKRTVRDVIRERKAERRAKKSPLSDESAVAQAKIKAERDVSRLEPLTKEVRALKNWLRWLPENLIEERAKITLQINTIDMKRSEEVKQAIYDYAAKLGLKGVPYNKVDTMLKNAKTAADLRRAIKSIDNTYSSTSRAEAINELLHVIEREYKKIRRTKSGAIPSTVDAETNKKMEEYLSNIVGASSGKYEDRVKSLLAWMDQVALKEKDKNYIEAPAAIKEWADDPTKPPPDRLSDDIRKLFQNDIGMMNTETMISVINDIEQIRKTGKTVLEEKQTKELAETNKKASAIASEIIRHKKKGLPGREAIVEGATEKVASERKKKWSKLAKKFLWQARDIDRIAVALTGKTKGTAFEKHVIEELASAYSNWKKEMGKVKAFTEKTYGDLDMKTIRNDTWMEITVQKEWSLDPQILETENVPLTLEGGMFIYAHSKNPKQREHLIATLFPSNRIRANQIIDDVGAKLPKQLKNAVEKQWEYYSEEQWAAVNETFSELKNINMDQEEYYIPASNLDVKHDANIEADLLATATKQAAVKLGATKLRVTLYGDGKTTEAAPFRHMRYFDVVIPNMNQAAHYSTMGIPVNRVVKLLNHESVTTALNDHDDAVKPVLMDWLRSLAYGKWSYGQSDLHPINGVFRILRNYAGSYHVLGKVSSLLVQSSSAARAMAKVKPKYMWKAILAFMSDPKDFMPAIDELSPIQATRMEDYEQAMSEWMETANAKKVVGGLTTADEVKKVLANILGAFDKFWSSLAWYAKYTEEIEAGREDRAIYEADKLVRQTQSGGGLLAANAMQRGSDVERAFTQFMSDAIKSYNLIDELVMGWRQIPGKDRAAYVAFGILLPAAIDYIIRSGFNPFREPEEYLSTVIMQPISWIPIIGQVGDMAVSVWNNFAKGLMGRKKDPVFDQEFAPPSAGIISDALREARKVFKIKKGWADKEKLPEQARATLNLVMILYGMPGGGQINKTIKNLPHLIEEKDIRYLGYSKNQMGESKFEIMLRKRKKPRKGSNDVKEFSKWYQSLSESEKEKFRKFARK